MDTTKPSGPGPSEMIGWRLRRERMRLGMEQYELAEIGGVGRMSQSNFESGKRQPRSLYLLRVALAGVDIRYVITGQSTVPDGDKS